MIETKHLNIWVFEEFGFAVEYIPKWMIHICILFISINIGIMPGEYEK